MPKTPMDVSAEIVIRCQLVWDRLRQVGLQIASLINDLGKSSTVTEFLKQYTKESKTLID